MNVRPFSSRIPECRRCEEPLRRDQRNQERCLGSNSEVIVDHVGDLSSTKEPIFLLSSLFLQTDLFLEVRVLDDLVQSRRNPRVEHLGIGDMSVSFEHDDFRSSTESTISTFFDPLHCVRGKI